MDYSPKVLELYRERTINTTSEIDVIICAAVTMVSVVDRMVWATDTVFSVPKTILSTAGKIFFAGENIF